MSSALMTKIFCVADKHFMKFSVVRVNRAGDTRLYLDSMICPNGQNYCALQFFNEIMYNNNNICRNCRSKDRGIKLDRKAGFTLVRCCYYEGN